MEMIRSEEGKHSGEKEEMSELLRAMMAAQQAMMEKFAHQPQGPAAKPAEIWSTLELPMATTKYYVKVTLQNTSDHHIWYHYREEQEAKEGDLGPNQIVEISLVLHTPYKFTLRCGRNEHNVTRTWSQRIDWDLARHFH